MKVPVYDAPQAEARADVPGGINLVQPDNSALERGIDRGADAFGKGISQAQEQYEKHKHEARSVDVANALAAYSNDATDAFHGAPSDPSTSVVAGGGSTPGLEATPAAIDAATAAGERTVQLPGIVNPGVDTGFLGLRGKAAATAEKPLFDKLAQRRDQIAAGLTDPEAKKLFLERVQQHDLELRAKAESHVGQQVEVAKQDAASNISDAAVRGSAADPGNDKLAAQLFGEAAGAVRGLGRGEDFEGLHDRALRADIAAARLDNLLAPGPHQDVVKAREVLEANRNVLGKQLDNYERAMQSLAVKDNGEALASGLLERVRKPNGFIDQGAAVAAWSQLPPEMRTKEARIAFDHGLELAQKQEVAVKSSKYNDALSAYLRRNNLNDVPPLVKAWMAGANGEPGNDAIGWEKLERIAKENTAHAKGEGPTDAQRFAFTQFDVDLKAHPDKYAAMSPEEFKRTWWDQFSKGDRERAGALFASTHGEVKPEAMTPAEGRMLLERGRDAGVFPGGNDVSKWDHDSALLYDASLRELEKRATNYRQLKREPPPFELVQKWTDELMQKGKIPGSGLFGSSFFEKSTTRLQAQEDRTEFQPVWTDDEKRKAVKTLQSKGVDPSDENVDSMLRIVKGMQPRPSKAPDVPKPPPTGAEVPADYGLDFSEHPRSALEDVQD